MNLPKIAKEVLIGLGVLWIFLGTLWAQEELTLESKPCIWYEGGNEIRAWLSLNEVAIFLQKEIEPSTFVELFDRTAKTVAENPYIYLLQTRQSFSRQILTSKIHTLLRQKNIRYAGPVFYLSPKKNPHTRLVLMGELIVRYEDNITEAEIGQLEAKYSLVRQEQFSFVKHGFLYQVGLLPYSNS